MTSYNTYKDIGQSKHVLAFLVQLSETATRHQANAAQVLATCKYLRDHFATNRETMEHGLTGALVELYKTPPSPLTESVLSLALYRGSTRGELIHIFSVVVSYLETEGGSELAESFAQYWYQIMHKFTLKKEAEVSALASLKSALRHTELTKEDE